MTQAIGIRLPDDILIKIDEITKEEAEDRSTIIRRLLLKGYDEILKAKALEKYKKGIITFSEAAKTANINLWEMEKYMIEKGYRSDYSIEDLEKDMERLNS